MPQESQLLPPKLALGSLGKKMVAAERGQDFFHVEEALLERRAEAWNVVHVHHCTASKWPPRPRDASSVGVIG